MQSRSGYDRGDPCRGRTALVDGGSGDFHGSGPEL